MWRDVGGREVIVFVLLCPNGSLFVLSAQMIARHADGILKTFQQVILDK